MSSMVIFEAKNPDKTTYEYLQTTELIDRLNPAGIEISRAVWDTNTNVRHLVEKHGEEILPVVMVNDFIMITGRYPSKEEIRQILHIPDKLIADECQGCGCCCIQGYECDE